MVHGLTTIEIGIRSYLVKSLQQYLKEGFVQSKYLASTININGLISVKSYIATVKKNSALTKTNESREFFLKIFRSSEVHTYLEGTSGDSRTQKFSQIIDKWIKLSPATPHIVKAFEVFEDYDRSYFLLAEYCPNSPNVFQFIKQLKTNFISGQITQDICRFAFLYVIQVSHALAIAHSNDLTHGAFNLSQVLITGADGGSQCFKIISFRPWLVKKIAEDLPISEFLPGNDEHILQIAKCKDLFDFGTSIFDMMIGKKDEHQSHQVVVEKSVNDREATQSYSDQPQVMPYLDSLPLGWIKQPECASLIQILHYSMVIDSDQNTVKTLQWIQELATNEYRKHFDESFEGLPLVYTNPPMQQEKDKDSSIALNNRASLLLAKVFPFSLEKCNSVLVNKQITGLRSEMLQQASRLDSQNVYAMLNLVLGQWKQGQIFDQDVCPQIYAQLNSVNQELLAKSMCLAFILGTGMPIDRKQAEKIVRKLLTLTTEDTLTRQIKATICGFVKLQMNAERLVGQDCSVKLDQIMSDESAYFKDNEFLRLNSVEKRTAAGDTDEELGLTDRLSSFPASARSIPPISARGQPTPRQQLPPRCCFKSVFFSSNEVYALLITKTEAVLVQIDQEQILLLKQIDLPPPPLGCVRGQDAEHEWVGAVSNDGQKIALHCLSDSSVYWKKESVGSHNGQTLTQQVKMFKNPVWIWHGHICKCIDLGALCPEEIVEINFELEEHASRQTRVIKPPKEKLDSEVCSEQSEEMLTGTLTPIQDPDSLNQKSQHKFKIMCKNLRVYGVLCKLSDQKSQKIIPQLLFDHKMPGGSSIPKGIFRVQPPTHHQFEPNSFESQYCFDSKLIGSGAPNWPMIKLSLYPQVREFIQKQELCGNKIQMATYEPKFLFVHQTSTYKNRPPHIFVWNVLSHRVVRRMKACSELFEFNQPQIVVNQPKKATTDEDQPTEVEVKDRIDFFGVSPYGTYMLCVVDNQTLCKKYLNGGVLSKFKPLLKGSFFQDIDHSKTTGSVATYFPRSLSILPVDNNASIDSDHMNKSKRGHISKAKLKLDNFIEIHAKYLAYQGQSLQKQTYLITWYNQVAEVMEDPGKFIYDCAKVSKQQKNTRKCMDIIRNFHYYFSELSASNQVTTPYYNMYSQKVSIKALHKIQNFDKVAFARNSDQIRYFKMCSTLKNWYLAVFHARVLQIYDHLTGTQEYEINMPSCRGIHFLDQEQLIILEDGFSSIFVCSIEMQKRSFQIKNTTKDEVKTVKYEDEHDTDWLTGGGFQEQRDVPRFGKHVIEDLEEIDYDELKDTAGVKVIRFDEDIRHVYTSRNTSPFGYIALIGSTKLSIYLAYADELVVMYDHTWTMGQWDLRLNNIGPKVELFDFTDSCESFVTYSTSGEIALWSLQQRKFTEIITKLSQADMPLSKLRVIQEDKMVIAYNRLQQKFIIIRKLENQAQEAPIYNFATRDAPVERFRVDNLSQPSEFFGECTDYQVDNTQQFLIAVFSKSNKLVVIELSTLTIKLKVCQPDILLQRCWLDETGCFVASLNDKKNIVQVYALEWEYKLKEPVKPLPKESPVSEMQRQALAEAQARMLEVERKKSVRKSQTCCIF